MGAGQSRDESILVIGGSSPLLDGVTDLLQLAGYRVASLSTWTEAEQVMDGNPPHLAIVDSSALAEDPQRLSLRIARASDWTNVPILCIGFHDDALFRELRRHNSQDNGRRLRCYAYTPLGVTGLLEVVRGCLA
jgi:DNA-binding response OmpR family regulator